MEPQRIWRSFTSDPQLFRWEDRARFTELLDARRELALAVFGLDPEPDPDNPELLALQFAEIATLLPRDEHLREAMDRAMAVFSAPADQPSQVDREELQRAVDSVRTHISETYRLHHRVVRNRRHEIAKQRLDDDGLLTPFEFTGGGRPGFAVSIPSNRRSGQGQSPSGSSARGGLSLMVA